MAFDETSPRLRLDAVSLRQDEARLIDAVSFDIRPGEIVALLGLNRSGKTALAETIAGFRVPSAGQVVWEGAPVLLPDPQDMRIEGVALVHEDLALVPGLAVWRNFILGREAEFSRRFGPFRLIDRGQARAATSLSLAELGFGQVDPDLPAGSLPVAARQALAIARAVDSRARLLILDEPGASLEEKEAERLLRALAGARQRGLSVLYVTDRIAEAVAVADRIAVLYRGRLARFAPCAELSERDLVAAMQHGLKMAEREGPDD